MDFHLEPCTVHWMFFAIFTLSVGPWWMNFTLNVSVLPLHQLIYTWKSNPQIVLSLLVQMVGFSTSTCQRDPQTSWAVMSQYIPWGLLAAEKQQVARALMEVHFSKNEVPSCPTSSQLEWWCDAPFIEGWRICEPNCCHGRWLSNRAIPGPLSTSSLRVKWLCLSHLGGVFSSFSWWNNGASKFHDKYLVRASFTWYNKHQQTCFRKITPKCASNFVSATSIEIHPF